MWRGDIYLKRLYPSFLHGTQHRTEDFSAIGRALCSSKNFGRALYTGDTMDPYVFRTMCMLAQRKTEKEQHAWNQQKTAFMFYWMEERGDLETPPLDNPDNPDTPDIDKEVYGEVAFELIFPSPPEPQPLAGFMLHPRYIDMLRALENVCK